jgi:hypothetical protein
MATIKNVGQRLAIAEARQLLRGLPIPYHEIEGAIHRVLTDKLWFEGETIRDLVADTIILEWTRGNENG